jgi:hypothetical protein
MELLTARIRNKGYDVFLFERNTEDRHPWLGEIGPIRIQVRTGPQHPLIVSPLDETEKTEVTAGVAR